MGCGASSNQVHVLDEKGTVVSKQGKHGRKKIKDADERSLISDDRGDSAASKNSRRSRDSGFDDEEELQRQRESALLGRPLPAVKPASERVEEKQLLATLHEEGLIQRPIGRGAFTVSFEVMSELDGQTVRKPPPRLAKLERKKKKKKVLTEAEIRQKLERAELRRKEQEQQRLNKIHSLQKTDIQSALAEQSQTQKELEVSSKTKDELVAENRERKLREKLAKLKAKQEHAAAVRQRRLQVAAAAAEHDPSTDQ